MVYVKEGNLYVQDGVNPPRQLTHSGQDSGPNISDDGEKIIFFRGRPDEMYKVYSISADGTQEQPLITTSILTALNLGYTNTTELRRRAFVPGTHQVLFSTQEFLGQAEYRAKWNQDLLLVNIDTGKVRRILAPGEVEHFGVSPDGKLVAIQTPDQVKVIDLSGKVIHKALITYPIICCGFYAVGLNWSQDSSTLFIIFPREWNDYIYEINPPLVIWKCPLEDGSPVEIQLTPPPLRSYYSISPDRNWIVYSFIHYDFLSETDLSIPEGIYLGNLQDGSAKLIAELSDSDNDFGWAPDSLHFSFEQYYSGVYQEVFGNLSGELTVRKDIWRFLDWVDTSHYLFGYVEMGELDTETTLRMTESIGEGSGFDFVMLLATEK